MSGRPRPSGENPQQPASRKRWHQFSLRTFLFLTALIGVGVGWVSTRQNWIRQRRAALADVEPWSGILVTEERTIGDPTSPVSPPWSLRWFGETQGIAKIRLEPAAIGWPAAIAEQKRLALLFPEAQVWIAPRNPGEPDPLGDNPKLVAEWAAELKLMAITFALRRLSRDRELTDSMLPVKRTAARQECLLQLAKAREALVRISADGGAPHNLSQRLRVRQRLFAAELELAGTRSARREIYRRHMATLADWQNADRNSAAEATSTAIRAAALEATATLLRSEDGAVPLGAGIEPLADHRLGAALMFERIDALYRVGARGGEAEIRQRAAFETCQTVGALAAARGDSQQQLTALRLAAYFSDLTVLACNTAHAAIPDGSAFGGLCEILPWRAETALALLALEKEFAGTDANEAVVEPFDLPPLDGEFARLARKEQVELERNEMEGILRRGRQPSRSKLLAQTQLALARLPDAAITNVEFEIWTVPRAVRSLQAATEVQARLQQLGEGADKNSPEPKLLDNLQSLARLVRIASPSRRRPPELVRCDQLFVAQAIAACRARLAETQGDTVGALHAAKESRLTAGELCQAADEAYRTEHLTLNDWIAGYACRREAHIIAARLGGDERQHATALREFASAMQRELQRLVSAGSRRKSDPIRLRFELAAVQVTLARLTGDRQIAISAGKESVALAQELAELTHAGFDAEVVAIDELLAVIQAKHAALRELAVLEGDACQEFWAIVLESTALFDLGTKFEAVLHVGDGSSDSSGLWQIACDYFLARSRLFPVKTSVKSSTKSTKSE